MLIPWAFSWWESSQSAEWFQDWHNIAHFWSAEESVGADFGYAGLLTVLGGIDAENPGVVAIGYGELDAQDAWGALDDSVYDQLLEFIPYPYVEAGAGHMNMK